MRRPNFFIVGAPKCATTALHAYLAQHPECFMSRVKEPAYFSRAHVRDDVRRISPFLQGEEAYLRLFSPATDAHKIVGESSTCYMRGEKDLEELREFAGNPKIVAMVRDPVLLVSSYYHFLRFQGWEPLGTLREAWKIQDERCAGRISAAAANRPDSLAYRNVALLGHQVQRLFRMFGRDNVSIIVVDDLREHTDEVCRKLQEFLGLTYVPEIELERKNVARTARVRVLDNLVKQNTGTVLRIKNWLKRVLGVRSLGVRRLIEQFNSSPIDVSIDRDLRDEMREYFRRDVQLLGQLLERDMIGLWGWTESDSRPANKQDSPSGVPR